MRKRFRRRAAIEPVMGHLKHPYQLMRCFLKGYAETQ
jgi:IS5 family transposase